MATAPLTPSGYALSDLTTRRLRDTRNRRYQTMPGGNASLYDPNAIANQGRAVSGAFQGPSMEALLGPQNPTGELDAYSILTRGGVGTPMTQMNTAPALNASTDARIAERQKRKAATAQRIAASNAALAEQQKGRTLSGLSTYDLGVQKGAIDPEKFEAAKEARKAQQALGRQRQFARAQFRATSGDPSAGVMFNDDGTLDLTGTESARAMAGRPDIAAFLANARDENALEQSQFDALLNQQDFDNEFRTERATAEDAMRKQEFEAKKKMMQKQYGISAKEAETRLTLAEAQATREQSQAEQNAELTSARMKALLAEAEETERRNAFFDEVGYEEGIKRERGAFTEPLPEPPPSPSDAADRMAQFRQRSEQDQFDMFDTLMSLPDDEQQDYMAEVGMPQSFIEDMVGIETLQDQYMPDAAYGALPFISPLAWLLSDKKEVSKRRQRRVSQAEEWVNGRQYPTSNMSRY